jgi:hypothetical protein
MIAFPMFFQNSKTKWEWEVSYEDMHLEIEDVHDQLLLDRAVFELPEYENIITLSADHQNES